ncbi:MAG: prepilin peptidase [Thermodesulfovibrionales bacterium]|nr:prepilin peptidase [Thermodesulfovibrionales bacterium]
MQIFEIIIFLFGLIVGSFLNVCIYRLPRGISIVTPPSSCPSCNSSIKPWHNIPVLSYLLLFGKCRSCSEKISIRYPLIELLNGVLYLTANFLFGFGWHLIPIFGFLSSMIVITFIDLDFQIIPDLITLPGILLGLLSATLIMPDPFDLNENVGFSNSIIGLLLGGGLFFLIAVLSRGGMGGGDIKMMAMVGAFLGWKAVLMVTFIGSLVGSVFGIFLMLFKGKGRKTKVPFGPFLSFGSIVTLFLGNIILKWYLNI